MKGWRGRLGFLIPPGNPTVEPEMFAMAPTGVTVHFARMIASGPTGSADGLEERTRSYLKSIDEALTVLAMVKPDVIVLAYTAGSYALGKEGEAAMTSRLVEQSGIPFITAFGSVISAFGHLGVRSVALGTPYGESTTLQGKGALEARGIEVVNYGRLEDVKNIYDETSERAYRLARSVDRPEAQAVFLSGVGMPTVDVLETLEQDLGKPVISAAGAMMWNALRTAGVDASLPGYGRLFRQK